MNIVLLKYGILITSVLATTALIAGPLSPSALVPAGWEGENVTADSVYQYGSTLFYQEIQKPGNEYLKEGTSGYSQNLISSDSQIQQYNYSWALGIASFKSGYSNATDALFQLAAVPDMASDGQKNAVCDKFSAAVNDLQKAGAQFRAAKGSIGPGSSSGFTIGMVIPKVDQITANAEEAETLCLHAVQADKEHNDQTFRNDLVSIESDVRANDRIYEELKALSSDFV